MGINIRHEGLFIILLGLFCVPNGLHAAWNFDDPHDSVPDHIEENEWKEAESKLPPFPRDENLVDLRLDYPGSRFSYFLDSDSLKPGDDGVVRYTLVIRSTSGASNVRSEEHTSELQSR